MFANDVDRVEKEARSIFGKWKSIEDARQRALVNMLFNLGMTRFLTFKRMIGAVIREDWDGAADEALIQHGPGKWVKERAVSQTC